MFFGACQQRLELLFFGGERGFLGLARLLGLFAERGHGGLKLLLFRLKGSALLGKFLVPLSFGAVNFVFDRLNFFLAGGELAFSHLFTVFEFPLQFFLGFFQLKAFFGELFGKPIEFSLAFGFFP